MPFSACTRTHTQGNTTRLKYSFSCLRKLTSIEDKGGQPLRLPGGHPIVDKVRSLTLDTSWCPDHSWVSLCDEMVSACYEILAAPDRLFDELLAELTTLVSPAETPDS